MEWLEATWVQGCLEIPQLFPVIFFREKGSLCRLARTEAVLRGVWVRQCFGELLWLSPEVSPKPED